jgi:hypothetical protein
MAMCEEPLLRTPLPIPWATLEPASIPMRATPPTLRWHSEWRVFLPRDSVVNVSQLLPLDRGFLTGHAGTLPARLQGSVDAGLRSVLQLQPDGWWQPVALDRQFVAIWLINGQPVDMASRGRMRKHYQELSLIRVEHGLTCIYQNNWIQ